MISPPMPGRCAFRAPSICAPYHYDFVGWLDAEPERGAVPSRASTSSFWRDRTLVGEIVPCR